MSTRVMFEEELLNIRNRNWALKYESNQFIAEPEIPKNFNFFVKMVLSTESNVFFISPTIHIAYSIDFKWSWVSLTMECISCCVLIPSLKPNWVEGNKFLDSQENRPVVIQPKWIIWLHVVHLLIGFDVIWHIVHLASFEGFGVRLEVV